MSSFRPCALIPVYNHERAVRKVIDRLLPLNLEIIMVDDGSSKACAQVLDALAQEYGSLLYLMHLAQNGGKGAACIAGFRKAQELGFTHALQVDADAQHDLEAAEGFLRTAQEHPHALVCAYPEYDASAPRARRWGHKVTNFWVALNTWGRGPADSLCGFRVYPLDETISVIDHCRIGLRMDFDLDIVVRLAWAGVRTINLPVGVTYPEGGLSHFKGIKDNCSISLTHAKHCTLMILDVLRLRRLWRLPRDLKDQP